jgi:hypothetical protein
VVEWLRHPHVIPSVPCRSLVLPACHRKPPQPQSRIRWMAPLTYSTYRWSACSTQTRRGEEGGQSGQGQPPPNLWN